jgi:hypothetical protein
VAEAPVPALPGWLVERKGRGVVLVFNPGQTMALFPKVSGARLDEKRLAQWAHCVEQRCRTVEPLTYGIHQGQNPMCGRYVTPDEAALERYWTSDRRSGSPLRERFNVAPSEALGSTASSPSQASLI